MAKKIGILPKTDDKPFVPIKYQEIGNYSYRTHEVEGGWYRFYFVFGRVVSVVDSYGDKLTGWDAKVLYNILNSHYTLKKTVRNTIYGQFGGSLYV